MTVEPLRLTPCWDCCKGRHAACFGWDVDDDQACVCPVAHDGNRRRPQFNGVDYSDDPGTPDEE